jgi:hypothetical protein
MWIFVVRGAGRNCAKASADGFLAMPDGLKAMLYGFYPMANG